MFTCTSASIVGVFGGKRRKLNASLLIFCMGEDYRSQTFGLKQMCLPHGRRQKYAPEEKKQK